jgi:hypothetical protein
MFCQRVSECRDLFVLRGAQTNSITVLQMAGRSLANDPEQAKRIDAIASGQGRSLLQALSTLIEQVVRKGLAAASQAKANVTRAKTSHVRTEPVRTRAATAATVSVKAMSWVAKPVRSPANDDIAAAKRDIVAA